LTFSSAAASSLTCLSSPVFGGSFTLVGGNTTYPALTCTIPSGQTLTLSGAGSVFAGALTVAGTLTVSGTATYGVTTTGSSGTLNFNAGVTLNTLTVSGTWTAISKSPTARPLNLSLARSSLAHSLCSLLSRRTCVVWPSLPL
jgi:hypothetical protein